MPSAVMLRNSIVAVSFGTTQTVSFLPQACDQRRAPYQRFEALVHGLRGALGVH